MNSIFGVARKPKTCYTKGGVARKPKTCYTTVQLANRRKVSVVRKPRIAVESIDILLNFIYTTKGME